jgi:glycosyltransferase involved in cell wall biosynthesis
MTPGATLQPFVSVIVPVFNDPVRLANCLLALERQTYPEDRFEIIVVDNGSDVSVDGIVAYHRNARSVTERRPGSYVARNLGIALARGEIIAFTDADCTPSPRWLEAGVSTLTRFPGCVVAGSVDVVVSRPEAPTMVELYERSRGFLQEKYVRVDGYGATANLFTYKVVFANVGSFDEELKSYGDVEWGRRAALSGFELRYCPDALVTHPGRRTFGELYRRIARVTGGLHDLRAKGKSWVQDHANLGKVHATFHGIWRDETLRGRMDKAKVLAVTCFVQCVKVAEGVRLRLGGVSRR